MRTNLVALGIAALANLSGCYEEPEGPPCEQTVAGWVDEDGDGFGAGESQEVCDLGDLVDNGIDCDDTDPEIHPEAEELCNGLDDDCNGELDNGFDLKLFYTDADGDGFGTQFPATAACEKPGPEWVRNADDCNDGDPGIHPDAQEVCNGGIDDDCNGLSDDNDSGVDPTTRQTYFRDADADGYGNIDAPAELCTPGSTYVDNADDCRDSNAAINPGATEICDRIDNDCDTLIDDQDDSVDPATFVELYTDSDQDGYGDGASAVMGCNPIPGVQSDNADDCDDTNRLVHPGRPEIFCDTIDNDCDVLTTDDVDQDLDGYTFCIDDCDDLSATTNPGAEEIPADGIDQNCNMLEACYQDVDNDGTRTPLPVEGPDRFCQNYPSVGPNLPEDCDDTDPTVGVTYNWFQDGDGDGYGGGTIITTSCYDPGFGLISDELGEDCDDGDPAINPGAVDPCNDGLDADCSGSDACASCGEWLAGTPGLLDGVYTIEPGPGFANDVWCDMSTDGGGWTLVGSTNGVTFNDAGTTSYYGDLQTLTPASGHREIWRGMRQVVGTGGDIRFACKVNPGDPTMTVDLSFYDVHWYDEITTGGDGDSCFNENNGLGDDFPPSRRNNITGALLPLGNSWGSGYLEGEDSCSDSGDFTVDFDDRGMDSNQSDGTDWGEDDSTAKCGVSGIAGGAWFIFVRE